MMRKIKSLLFGLITIVISLVVIDLFLHAAAYLVPSVDQLIRIQTAKVPDPLVGRRPNPIHPDHDEHGFRNPREYDTADVVAMGDSQTYGSGVAAQYAWPRVLEQISDRPVYSMASG